MVRRGRKKLDAEPVERGIESESVKREEVESANVTQMKRKKRRIG